MLVVELGEHETHSRERSTAKHAFGHKFMGNGIFVTEAGTMSIMAAKTFGGGSTVNWSASLRPPHAVRQAWAKQYGLPHFMTTDFSDDIEYVRTVPASTALTSRSATAWASRRITSSTRRPTPS